MTSDDTTRQPCRIPANVPAFLTQVDAGQWQAKATELHTGGARFLSLWGADDRDRHGCFCVYAAWLLPEHVLVLQLNLNNSESLYYPDLAPLFPAARRMQRAAHDLLGISAAGADHRGWLRHNGWSATEFPLRRDVTLSDTQPIESQPYPFVQVEGDGVHEIAVGPVHAGIIEPGHFRFSVVGEKVLRLEERLGYTHKGVARLFQTLPQAEGHRLAARISGDSAVAFSWAWCLALESMTRSICPTRATTLRALALEHERLANHLGDLGALGNDAGFAFGLTQFSYLKEDLVRANAALFGARYLMDFIVPGGVAHDISAASAGLLPALYARLHDGTANMRSIYDEHAGIQDRFRETGCLSHDQAARLGAIGLAARASGIAHDLRADHPWAPYDRLQVQIASRSEGDVAARVQVRFDEIFESLRLCRSLLGDLEDGPVHANISIAGEGSLGVGIVEGWRGPVMIAMESGEDETVRWCHAHDPSWQNWPLLEYAILGNLVPDFPLINKSFNLSYSGQDG